MLMAVGNNYYRDSKDEFVLMCIEEEKLEAEVKYEAPAKVHGTSATDVTSKEIMFPHVYGPINLDSITQCHPVERAEDGTFITVMWNQNVEF